MKKILFVVIVFFVVLTACNRKAFVKEIVGTWKYSSYILAGQDMSRYYDTTFQKYQLVLADNYVYAETWTSYTFVHDSTITVDTLAYDSVLMTRPILRDTFRFIDTLAHPHIGSGKWALLNSEEDLQLRDDSDATNPKQYRILKLDKSHLNLLKGNEEFHLTH
ncbi:MAG: hypothetical protein JWO06_658 [Bacteroidota bacterium]|nr:hypothetical protein [Bacteroidota bacterium]